MSTANFSRLINAKKYYTIFPEDAWEVDDISDNIFYDLKSRLGNYEVFQRSKEIKNICSIYAEKVYKDFYVNIQFDVIIQDGYYEGANIDYRIKFSIDGSNFEDIYDIESEFDSISRNYEVSKAKMKFAKNWLVNTCADIQGKLENVLNEHTEAYKCVGIFSNGEAIYEKCK